MLTPPRLTITRQWYTIHTALTALWIVGCSLFDSPPLLHGLIAAAVIVSAYALYHRIYRECLSAAVVLLTMEADHLDRLLDPTQHEGAA